MNTVQASNCILEPLVAAHAPAMFDVLSDPAIYEFENTPPESAECLAKRYVRLESRGPDEGSERWLNWVIRLPTGQLAGYVQATIQTPGTAYVAYEMGSRHWRQGIGSVSVQAMLDELRINYGIHTFIAVLKEKNFRSKALLDKLGFVAGSKAEEVAHRDEDDEIVMVKSISEPSGV